NCDLAGAFQSLCAHHADVHPGDCQNACAAPGSSGDIAAFSPAVAVIRTDSTTGWTIPAFTFAKEDPTGLRIENEFARKIRCKVFGHADRSHARAAAAVRDAKGFMQIQMTNISTVIARTTQPALRIHVRAIHENLTTVRVHDVADFAYGRFEHAVRRWI